MIKSYRPVRKENRHMAFCLLCLCIHTRTKFIMHFCPFLHTVAPAKWTWRKVVSVDRSLLKERRQDFLLILPILFHVRGPLSFCTSSHDPWESTIQMQCWKWIFIAPYLNWHRHGHGDEQGHEQGHGHRQGHKHGKVSAHPCMTLRNRQYKCNVGNEYS